MTNEFVGFNAYCLFHAVKLHFTSKYDFIHYNGKINLKKENFLGNKTKYHYYKLCNKYSLEELKFYFIANMIEMKTYSNIWIGNFVGDNCVNYYENWIKRTESLAYLFETELTKVFEKYGVKETFSFNGNQYPPILIEHLRYEISLETMVILNSLMKLSDVWDVKIKETFVWPKLKTLIENYTSFLPFDKKKYSSIMRKIHDNYMTEA